MKTLREEYNKHKQEKAKNLQEASISWLMENAIILNEGFNRESLQRLQASISKFETSFAPFAAMLPHIRASLDEAIELLNRITMGDKITRKDGRIRVTKDEAESLQDPASYMVKYTSLLYNNLSRFFNKDLKILLELPIFKMARENPDTPIKNLTDAPKIERAIHNALEPSPELNTLLKRMYRSMELPDLKYSIISDQMLNLTASQLMQLTNIEKVPLVVTPNGSMEEATSTNPKAQTDDKSGGGDEYILTEEEGQALLKEIGEVNPDQIKKIADALTKVQSVIKTFPELQATNQALENLRKQALAAVSNNDWGGAKGAFIAAQANMVYSYFDKLGELWPKIKPFFDDGLVSDEELKQLENLINRSQGGMVQKIANFFKSRPVPALSPPNLTSQIIQTLKKGQMSGNPQTINAQMQDFVSRLAQLKLPPVMTPQGQPVQAPQASSPNSTQSSATSTAGTPSKTTGQPQPSGSPQASQATGQQTSQNQPQNQQQNQQGNQAMNPVEVPQIIQQMAKAMGVDGESPMFLSQMDKLIQAGWKIVPPGR